jgi:methyl-accepting chemotaxis protein
MAVIGVSVYFIYSNRIMKDMQNELLGIATRTAALIPVASHESLLQPADQQSENYRVMELYLQSVMAGNPRIDDVYTLRPTNQRHLMTFVVSGKGNVDENNDGIIEENEQKAMLGEEYDTTDLPQMEEGLIKPSVDQAVTNDKWGSWLSGYAPLKDSSGKTVAILGVDFAAKTISQERHYIIRALLIFEAICTILLLFVAWLISRRVSWPYKMLAEGMNRIKHGDMHFTMAVKNKGEEAFIAELFNSIRETFHDYYKNKKEKEGK